MHTNTWLSFSYFTVRLLLKWQFGSSLLTFSQLSVISTNNISTKITSFSWKIRHFGFILIAKLVLWFYNKNKDGCNVSQLVVSWLFCELQWSINDIYAYVYVVYIFKCLFWTLIVGGHFENYPDDRSRNSTECTTFSVMVLGIERHLLLHLQLEMNKKIFFTYTLIYMYNDDNDIKNDFFCISHDVAISGFHLY